MSAFDCGNSRPAHHYSAGVIDAPARNVVLYSQGTGTFAPTHEFSDAPEGVDGKILHVKGMPVFRSGSFKDSLGELKTWETVHIDQMVSSHDFLKAQSIFADVPVRKGHGSFFGDPMTGLVGYHEGLSSVDALAPDGETYRYLLADFSLNTPEAQQAYLNGLWRNRSSEVGYFESNNGTGYYPVYQGFAFVDIPAVQFLNQFGQEKKRSFSILMEQEIPQMSPQEQAAADAAAAATAAAQNQNHGAPALPIPGTTPVPVVAPANQPFAFSIAGAATTDYAAVQAHIASVEAKNAALAAENATFSEFKAETARAGRIAFVSKLAADRKILASQVGSTEVGKEDGLVGVALSLNDSQFTSWSVAYEAMPVNPLFTPQASGGTQTPDADLSADEKAYAAAKAKVEWHRAGKTMPETDLVNTDSYKTYSKLHTSLGKEGAL